MASVLESKVADGLFAMRLSRKGMKPALDCVEKNQIQTGIPEQSGEITQRFSLLLLTLLLNTTGFLYFLSGIAPLRFPGLFDVISNTR